MKITACKINHLTKPLGYEISSPRVSWVVEESLGKKQTEARVVVSRDAEMKSFIYDSGYGNLNSLGTLLPMNLEARTRYYWRVTVRSDAGEEATSEVQFFETGKEGEAWSAKWITCSEQGDRSPVFSKKICLKGKVESARLYISGLGMYEVNYLGQRIGEEYLTPHCNAYDRWIQYQTYDMTHHLGQDGELSVILGNGWYKGRFGFDSRPEDPGRYGNSFLLIAELHIRYQDGSEEIVATDESWKVGRSCISFSNIYDGEELLEADTEECIIAENATLAEYQPDVPIERYSQPVMITKEIPVKLLQTPAGEKVLDVGQNISGIFRMKVRGEKGQRIRLCFGEVMQDGNFYRENLRSAKAEYVYVSDGTSKTIQPKFTFYGYRYVLVEGIRDLREEDFTALALTTQMENTGELVTGHELVNKLISNIKWGCEDNFVDVPTDCPQRDERMGWTGDTQVFSATATYLKDSYAFYRKFLHDLAHEQKSHGGGVPYTIPSFGVPAGSAVWGDAATIIPWNLYCFYNDVTILSEQFESMKGWVDYMTEKDGEDCGWRREFHFGDWLALDVPGADVEATSGATDKAFIADVYYMYSTEILAKSSEMLGKNVEKEKYDALAQKIRRRIQYEFYSASGRCCCDTQTGLVLTLKHQLAPEDVAANRLREKLMNNNYKLDCGFVGAPLLCMTLAEHGMEDIAERLLLNEEFPGWLNEVKLGATTVWERWNSLDQDGHISSTGMNSLNHYAYGAVLEWMYAHLAGLKLQEPGFKKVTLKPNPMYRLDRLSAAYRSPAGTWKSGWRVIDENHIEIEVTVPFGAEADLTLPWADDNVYENMENPMFSQVHKGICHLNAGTYKVSYRTTMPMVRRLNLSCTIRTLLDEPDSRKILENHLPGIHQIPENMRDYTIPEALQRMNLEKPELLAALEQGLAVL